MFSITPTQQIFETFNQRLTVIKKLSGIPLRDVQYLTFLAQYEQTELSGDIQLFNYEQALKENAYLQAYYPRAATEVWMIGRSGQGDEWYLGKTSARLLHYDHDKEAGREKSALLDFDLSFTQFVQAGLVIQQLETYLDKNISEQLLGPEYKKALATIDPNFYDLYPYRYFS